MKICPFVSHLLGDDNSKTWTIERTDAGSDAPEPKGGPVVILGYDDGESNVATQSATQVAKKSKSKADTSSPLYCLKESCRFYKEKTGDCQFDLIFSMLENGKKPSPGQSDASTKELAKDIDKIWKFQTKSVSELIKSLGDAEKTQAKSVQNIGKDLEKSLDILAAKFDKTSGGVDVKKSIATLQKKLDDREQGIEDLASTVSELVLNLHENIRQLDTKWDDTFKRVDDMSRSLPDEARMRKLVEETVSGRNKDVSTPDFVKALAALDDRLEAMMKSQQRPNPRLEEKLQAALDARSDLEAESRAFQEKIADRMQDFRTQQKIWEERLRKVAEHQDQILENLKDLKKQRENERGRNDQKDARKYNNLGVASFHNGAYEMARDQFLHAVKIDPEFAEAYNNLGLAYTEMDEDEHATEAFSRAVELNPDLHAAYNNLGYIFFRKGNYDQAIEMYNEALTRSTDNSSAYTNLGNAYFKLGRRDDAKKAWTKALEIDPGNEKAKRNLDRTRAGND